MSVAYLLDPTNQYQNRAGVNNVNGYFEVFEMNTDDRATVYTDFAGTLAPARIGIDNNGRAVMIVESGIPYRVEMHEPSGDLVFTQQPVYTVATGGGASVTRVTSTDGSIGVEATTIGSVTTYDLSSGRDSSDLLEWVRCDGAEKVAGTDVYRPTYTDGTLYIGEKGIELGEGRYYHVTAHIRATKNTQREPFYDKIYIGFQTNDGTNTTQITRKSEIIDYSLGLTQEFEVSTDVYAQADCELELVINGSDVAGGDIEVIDVEAHRIFSGSPAIPSGVLSRARAAETYQRKLIAGQNITITETEEGDIIASTGGGGGGGGATYQGGEGIVVNNTTYRISIDDSVVQEKLTAGDNITITDDNVLSATVPSVDISGKADKVEDAVDGNLAGLDSNGNLTDSGIAADRVVTDPDYVHTDNNFTTELKNKLINIEAGAQANVQADWLESDSSSDAFIKNKPNIPAGVIVDQVYDATSTNAQSGTAVAQAVASVNAVPSSTSSDENKVLTVDSNGDPVWATAQGGSSDIFLADTTSTNEDVFQAYLAGKVLFYKDASNGIYNLTRTSESTSAGYLNTVFSGYRASNVNVAEFANVTVFSVTIQSQNGHANSNLFSASITNKYVRVLNMPLLNGNAGKVLTVNSGATAVEWDAAPNGLPASTSADENKVLTVDSNGDPTWATSQAQVQSNWTEADSGAVSYVQNKPTEINLIAGTGISLTMTAQGLVISLA